MSAPPAAPIRTVIADDHKLFREGLHALLDLEERVEVVGEARDGEEAVLLARTHAPDLVLMDIDMPGMDGLLATSLIREIGGGVKVLMLSNHEDDARVSSAMRAGASGYVVKRVGMTDLVMIIKATVDGGPVVSPYLADMLLQERRKEVGGHAASDFGLTGREVKILGLLVKGYSNKEISNAIYISQDTVKVHLKHIFEKLGVDCRTKAAVKALQHGLLQEAEAAPDRDGR